MIDTSTIAYQTWCVLQNQNMEVGMVSPLSETKVLYVLSICEDVSVSKLSLQL